MKRRAGAGARQHEQRCPGAVQADRSTLSAWTGLLSRPRVDSRWTAPVDSCPGTQWGLGTQPLTLFSLLFPPSCVHSWGGDPPTLAPR